MASLQYPVVYRGWEGGVNDSRSLLSLRPNELSDIRNFYVARDGHLRRRAGQSAVYTSFQSTNVAHGLAQVRLGGTRYLITTYGTAIHKDNTGAITGTASITAGANNPVTMTVFRDLLIGTQSDTTQGLATPFAWNGSGNAAPLTTSPPTKAVSVATFKNRLFFWNVTFGGTDYPESVVWSKIDTATTWPTNQIAAVYRGTGRYGTALKPFFRQTDGGDGEVLVAFKDTGTFFLYHNPNANGPASAFGIGRISDSVGCPAPLGVVEADGVLYWPSYSGFYRMGPDLVIGPKSDIGGSLQQLWKKVPKNRVPHIKGAYLEDLKQVWFSLSVASAEGGAQTTNNIVLVWDTYFQRWVGIYDSINANVMAQVIDSNLNRHIYTGDYSNYLIYKQNTGNDDNGTGFRAWIKTGFMDLGSSHLKKNFRRVVMELGTDTDKVGTVYTTLYNVTVTQSRPVSVGSTGTLLDAFTLDVDSLAGPDYGQWWARQAGSARRAQFELQLPANATTFDLYGLGYYVVPTRSGPGVAR